MMARFGSGDRTLPAGYTPYDYIVTDGNSYLDLDWSPEYANPTGSAVVKSVVPTLDVDVVLLGARAGNSRFFFNAWNINSVNLGYGSYLTFGHTYRTLISEGAAFLCTAQLTSGSQAERLVAGSNDHTNSWSNTMSNVSIPSLYLFRANYPGGNSFPCPSGTKVWNVKIFSDFDMTVLVADLVACTDANDVPGMYDLKRQRFFSNAGSGSFTVGND